MHQQWCDGRKAQEDLPEEPHVGVCDRASSFRDLMLLGGVEKGLRWSIPSAMEIRRLMLAEGLDVGDVALNSRTTWKECTEESVLLGSSLAFTYILSVVAKSHAGLDGLLFTDKGGRLCCQGSSSDSNMALCTSLTSQPRIVCPWGGLAQKLYQYTLRHLGGVTSMPQSRAHLFVL